MIVCLFFMNCPRIFHTHCLIPLHMKSLNVLMVQYVKFEPVKNEDSLRYVFCE